MSCRSLAQNTTVLFVNNPTNLAAFEYSKNAKNKIVYMGFLLLKDRKLLTNSAIRFLLQLTFNLYKAAKELHNKNSTTEHCSASGKLAQEIKWHQVVLLLMLTDEQPTSSH